MGNELTVSVVDSHEGLTSLRDEWNRLLDGSRACSLCLRWEWLHTWWEIYRDCGVKLHVLLMQDGGRLVGIAPFFLQMEERFGFLPFRTLRFLGSGEPEREEVTSEYLDIVAHAGYEERVAEAVWAHLHRLGSWDHLILNNLLPDSLVLTVLRRLMTQARMPMMLENVGIRYSIHLPRAWDDYLAMLAPAAAKRLLCKRRKLERAGQVAEMSVTSPQELDHAIDELIRLHTLRWTARGRPGVFASARFTAYHKRLAHTLLPLGMLKIRLLSLHGTNIAVLYNMRYAGTEYFYQGGLDVNHAGKYSPGLMAHAYAIESTIRSGLHRYDFMRGGTVSYKTEFGCAESLMYDVRVFGHTARGRLLALEAWAKKKLRPIKQKLQKQEDSAESSKISRREEA